jgi:[acyl-carrier-protein] S-malonyltransferase
MERAQQVFTEFLKTLHWFEPKVPFVSAVTGKEETSAASIFEVMTKQIVSSVRWISAVEYMYEKGVKIFVEVGPKKVLSSLISQILKDKEHKVFNVEDRGTLEQFSKEVRAFL